MIDDPILQVLETLEKIEHRYIDALDLITPFLTDKEYQRIRKAIEEKTKYKGKV